MKLRGLSSLLFVVGLGVLLAASFARLEFGAAPMRIGQTIQQQAVEQTGAANIVTSVVLGYRGLDTLGELTILFVAATAVGMVLGGHPKTRAADPEAGFILRQASDLLFPFLLVLGIYIILHGHLTPGGGFQGGAILAAAFFIPLLARPAQAFNATAAALLEGGAGVLFIGVGLLALAQGGDFLQPLGARGETGRLLSAGSLPLLYLAVGIKVGAELAGLMARLAHHRPSD